MTVISPEQVREAGQIIPLDRAKEILATTEPLGDITFQLDGTSNVSVTMPEHWNGEEADIRHQPGPYITDCTIDCNEAPGSIRLSKDAILKITSLVGINREYVMKTPGPLIAANVNYWLNNAGIRGSDSLHLLTKDGNAVAARKEGLQSFPNLPLLEQVEGQLRARYGRQELFADAKFHHDYQRTSLRIIVPDSGKTMPSKRSRDDKPDRWSVGVQFINSLMADPESRLSLSGYLFSWWCTNGAITQHGRSGLYNRRTQDQGLDMVSEWVRAVTEQALEAVDPALDEVEMLTGVDLEGELNAVLADLFTTYRLPPKLRPNVTEALIESDDLTGYGLMQAITQAANDPLVSDQVAQTTMEIGGMLPHGLADRCDSCHRVLVS
jgi:hypothetical protein